MNLENKIISSINIILGVKYSGWYLCVLEMTKGVFINYVRGAGKIRGASNFYVARKGGYVTFSSKEGKVSDNGGGG